MIVENSGWRHLKEKNQLFLSCEYQKCIIPPSKWHNFLKLPQTKNGKLYFSPMFQKVELLNLTFFQQKEKKMGKWNRTQQIIGLIKNAKQLHDKAQYRSLTYAPTQQ